MKGWWWIRCSDSKIPLKWTAIPKKMAPISTIHIECLFFLGDTRMQVSQLNCIPHVRRQLWRTWFQVPSCGSTFMNILPIPPSRNNWASQWRLFIWVVSSWFYEVGPVYPHLQEEDASAASFEIKTLKSCCNPEFVLPKDVVWTNHLLFEETWGRKVDKHLNPENFASEALIEQKTTGWIENSYCL